MQKRELGVESSTEKLVKKENIGLAKLDKIARKESNVANLYIVLFIFALLGHFLFLFFKDRTQIKIPFETFLSLTSRRVGAESFIKSLN